ncbi:hypothetical protein T4A_8465 [Trichinella pseudospiralis]|uniref:Uncharacterized protein n=1 Tax=Trichinella pseudospiralis TaxID=6337 RepID=A0A0V1E8N7_TRIPS|nr:hypothetical protein T4A_8465 [Trichinella pseudospiralis]
MNPKKIKIRKKIFAIFDETGIAAKSNINLSEQSKELSKNMFQSQLKFVPQFPLPATVS